MDRELNREQISRRYLELSELHDKDLQDILELASEICGTPIALVTLLDRQNQYFKAKKGLDIEGTPREVAFCNYTVANDDVFVVNDAAKDERFKNNPLVTGFPNIGFYAGYPLTSTSGVKVGSLCVIDHQPRSLTPLQSKSLEILSKQIIQRIELGLSLDLLQKNMDELQKQKEVIDQSEVMLRAFFDSPDEYQILLNKDLQVVAINNAAKQMFAKYNKKEPKEGEPLIESIANRSAEQLKAVAPTVLSGTTVQKQRMFTNKKGEELWVKLTLSPAYNSKKEVIGLALIGSDINSEKQHEEKVQKQHQSLCQIAEWQSHKLRHPVSSILGLTNLIKEDNFTFREEYISSLDIVAKQLDKVIKEIVTESRSA